MQRLRVQDVTPRVSSLIGKMKCLAPVAGLGGGRGGETEVSKLLSNLYENCQVSGRLSLARMGFDVNISNFK